VSIFDELKIAMLEKHKENFLPRGGLDILEFIKQHEKQVKGFQDYAGEYYKKPDHFSIGEDLVYKKKQPAGEISATCLAVLYKSSEKASFV